jgi:RHS repeat-associated protein
MGYSLINEQVKSTADLSGFFCPRRVVQKVDGAPFYRIILSTKYWDGDAKLAYYGYRYLSPWLGRWVSRDPYKEAGGCNLYGYVLNNAVSLSDNLGLTVYSRYKEGGLCCVNNIAGWASENYSMGENGALKGHDFDVNIHCHPIA